MKEVVTVITTTYHSHLRVFTATNKWCSFGQVYKFKNVDVLRYTYHDFFDIILY